MARRHSGWLLVWPVTCISERRRGVGEIWRALSVLRRARVVAGLLAFGLFSGLTVAADDCRVAFDMGSSGIRAGASNSGKTARAEIDFLTPLWAGRGLDETLPATISALNDLPRQAGFAADCQRMGGGFSAWRLAAAQDPLRLAAQLAEIYRSTGVAVLVIPQIREGSYGYRGAQQLLGDGLQTSHILDIGGGSLQVAGEQTTFGEPLGQKVWHRRLCIALGRSEPPACQLQPLTVAELFAVRTLAKAALQGVRPALGGPATMTAISRPVSRGVLPAVNRLIPRERDRHRLQAADLAQAIDLLAPRSADETAQAVDSKPAYVNFLLSDMLLVEGLLAATGSKELSVAEIDLTNLPGQLLDDQAFRWAERHDCYRERLVTQSVAAFDSDPASCPEKGRTP